MKIAVNKCYGGFSLSLLAQKEYCLKRGKNVYFYNQTKYDLRDGINEFARIDDVEGEHSSFAYSLLSDFGSVINNIPENDEDWFFARDIPRDDLDLIATIEELGEKASGDCGDIRIVEIPDDINWQIEEYDGMEWVSEVHRTW